jgi:hypothetical protein
MALPCAATFATLAPDGGRTLCGGFNDACVTQVVDAGGPGCTYWVQVSDAIDRTPSTVVVSQPGFQPQTITDVSDGVGGCVETGEPASRMTVTLVAVGPGSGAGAGK